MSLNTNIRKNIEVEERLAKFLYLDMNNVYIFVFLDEIGKASELFNRYVFNNNVILQNMNELKTFFKNTEKKQQVKVIVFSDDYKNISKELTSLGLNPFEQVFDGEIIAGLKEEPDKNDVHKLLFTGAGTGEVGGIFQYDFEAHTFSKIIEGDFREMKKVNDGYIALNEEKGIMIFDLEFNIINEIRLNSLELHGFDICNQTGLMYLVETANNSIGVYDLRKSKKIDNILIGRNDQNDEYHINDILVDGNDIYLSMFSKSGLFHFNQWSDDGAIIIIDRQDRFLKEIYLDNLCGPHTVYKACGDIFICDSMNYTLYRNKKPMLKMPGFIRGVFYDGYCLYIGQSKKRRIIETAYRHSYCSLDAGFHCYNLSGRTTNFIAANFTKNIYSIVVD